jgi:hypothetical protein
VKLEHDDADTAELQQPLPLQADRRQRGDVAIAKVKAEAGTGSSMELPSVAVRSDAVFAQSVKQEALVADEAGDGEAVEDEEVRESEDSDGDDEDVYEDDGSASEEEDYDDYRPSKR